MQSAEPKQHGADYEQAAEFVDALLAKKYPGEPITNHKELREQAIQTLNDRLDDAIVANLTEEQRSELDALAADSGDDSSAFLSFFIKQGVDLTQIFQSTMIKFGNEFLGADHE